MKKQFNKFGCIYCRIRRKHPNWVHRQIAYATVYVMGRGAK